MSGRDARSTSTTRVLALAVASHGATGHSCQACRPLHSSSSMRGWSLGYPRGAVFNPSRVETSTPLGWQGVHDGDQLRACGLAIHGLAVALELVGGHAVEAAADAEAGAGELARSRPGPRWLRWRSCTGTCRG